MDIPVELIEQIESGNCVLFLGWTDLEMNMRGESQMLSANVIAQHLADRVNCPGSAAPLYEVAEYFEVKRGRHALIQYVCDAIEKYTEDFPSYYHAVANLPFNIIVSTSLGNFLKRILQEKGKKFVQIIRDEEISFIDEDKLLLVKLHGDIDNKGAIVITKEDYIGFFEQLPSISNLLKYYFSTKTLLFLEHNLDDPHFLRLYAYANQRTKGYQRRAFAVKLNPSQYEMRLWERRNLKILDISTIDFLATLASRIRIKHLPPKDTITILVDEQEISSHVHKSPYKFLSSYDEQDVDIFFGRDRDITRATQKLLSSKLMILYGRSGFGKTSLLCAGIIPRLIQANYLPVYARCARDPLFSIKVNIIDRLRQLNGSIAEETIIKLQDAISLSLSNFIREFKKVEGRPLVVFVDQFEEFFISLGDATRKQFEAELAECVDSPYIDATFLLSLREDFLPELHELKSVYNVFENRYRLKALTTETAREAITKPAKKFGTTFDNGLISLIITELSQKGQIDPAQMQIVCDRLYNSLPEKETQVTMALYEELGGAKLILADYVDSIMDNLGPKRRSVAQKLLQRMVTAQFTRISLHYSDAVLETADIAGWNEENTRRLLNDLVKARLVRRIADVEEAYELTHEYLINKIREWIDLEMLKVKEAQDLLRQEYNHWQRHRIPMDKSALEIVDSQRDQLILNNKLISFILAATVRYDFEFDYWLERNQGNQLAVHLLLQLLRNGEPSAQRIAGIALGQLTDDIVALEEIYNVYESVANPNTVKRIEGLQSQNFHFVKDFVESVRRVVEHRFAKDMALVEAGEFLMGATLEEIEDIAETNQIPMSFFDGQYPQRMISLESFHIDKFLVTNAEFQEFKPTHTFPEGHENHPATHVTWYEAQEYARWIGKELPTEEEWEKTARGTDGRSFPWGEEWDPERCNTKLSGYGGTTPVGQFPSGADPYGGYDMSGNVWEWTTTWLNEERERKIIKGGSWSDYGILPWGWYRYNYQLDSGYSNVGFRCIRRVISSNERPDQPGSPISVEHSEEE